MSDYYGVSELAQPHLSITETLIKKYQLSSGPLKVDNIKEGYRAHVSNGEDAEKRHTKGNDSSELVKDEQTSGGLFAFIKSYIQYRFTQLTSSLYSLGERSDFTEREEIENLLMKKKIATSYATWFETSEKLDELQKFNKWKEQKESALYDYKLIESHLKNLKDARLSGDLRKLVYLIRTTWTRNIGNIGNVNLYRHSHTGTKRVIEEYLEECQLALDEVVNANQSHGVDDKYIMSMLVQTRKNIGRTALVLSGGGCFGLFHIGILTALLEEKVLPRIISGSSAGAIVASILCVHTNDEIVELVGSIVEKQFDIFGDDQTKGGFLKCLARFLKYGTWYNNIGLQNTMIEFLGDLTFREAYNRSGRILNITVSPASVHEHPRLLNYLTAPSVLIWSAVCASCSLPGIFESSTIYEKNMKTGATQEWHHTSVKFVDGSVDNDMPITRLSEMFNVDHIIACQVNPHVVPFLKLSVTCVGGEIETEYSAKFKTKLSHFYGIWAAEVTHYLQMCEEIGIARNICTKLRSVLSQQYSGDITILPDLKEVVQLNKLLSNPSPQYLLHLIMKGARSTWPKISIIRNHCGLEFSLDNALRLLRSRNFKSLNLNSLALINSPTISSTDEQELHNFNPSILDGVSSSLAEKAASPASRGPTRPTPKKRVHNRHRSETMNVGSMKQLRTVRSNVSVSTAYDQHSIRVKTPTAKGKFHRSYSTSNDDTGGIFYNNDNAPGTETSSPLKLNYGSEFDYFRPAYKTNQTKAFSPSSEQKFLLRKSSDIHLTASPKAPKTELKKKSYVNIDQLDGLFGNANGNADDFDSGGEEIDPLKVADISSSPSKS